MAEAKWYVVHTYSGYENKVASDLATMVESRGMQDLIQDIKIPTETVTEIKDDVKREVERKEIEITSVQKNGYDNLLEQVRLREHELNNHMLAIYSAHHT
ncbi:MAG: transcription termination/antitermination NusG family protein, partial [Acutalibacteraceae bacterium]|nr:transcription termination/antitermination NusG family protein [Acutalibacteraceae bacterium]